MEDKKFRCLCNAASVKRTKTFKEMGTQSIATSKASIEVSRDLYSEIERQVLNALKKN